MSREAIRVGVRLRPLVIHERGQNSCLAIKDSDVSVITSSLPDGDKVSYGPWRFDHALDSSQFGSNYINNEMVYNVVGRRIVQHALEGFNACLFAYGQTGTGKTTTVLGDDIAGPGLLILLLKDLFEHKSQEEGRGDSVNIVIQMLEVYNEKVFDLLQGAGPCGRDAGHGRGSDLSFAYTGHNSGHGPGDNNKPNVELHVLPTGVQIKGAESKLVDSVEECLRLIELGNKRKHTASTAMNEKSSRGHTVFKLVIQRALVDDGVKMDSEIYFADLAGHEDEKTTKVTGDRLIELSFINKSLMWLQSAIRAMAVASKGKGAQSHRDGAHTQRDGAHTHRHRYSGEMSIFRNSKLTLLLSNALLGNSLVDVIVTLSPAAAHFSTSLSSLRFANEVKHISVDVHSSAHLDPQMQIKKLEAEVKQLKEQLLLARSGSDSVAAADNLRFRSVSDPGAGFAKLEASPRSPMASPASSRPSPFSSSRCSAMSGPSSPVARSSSAKFDTGAGGVCAAGGAPPKLKLDAALKQAKERLALATSDTDPGVARGNSVKFDSDACAGVAPDADPGAATGNSVRFDSSAGDACANATSGADAGVATGNSVRFDSSAGDACAGGAAAAPNGEHHKDMQESQDVIWQKLQASLRENEELRKDVEACCDREEQLMSEKQLLSKSLHDVSQRLQDATVENVKLQKDLQEARERKEQLVSENRSLMNNLQSLVARSLTTLSSKFEKVSRDLHSNSLQKPLPSVLSSGEELEEQFDTEVFVKTSQASSPPLSPTALKFQHSEEDVVSSLFASGSCSSIVPLEVRKPNMPPGVARDRTPPRLATPPVPRQPVARSATSPQLSPSLWPTRQGSPLPARPLPATSIRGTVRVVSPVSAAVTNVSPMRIRCSPPTAKVQQQIPGSASPIRSAPNCGTTEI